MKITSSNTERRMYIVLADISGSTPLSESQLDGEVYDRARNEFVEIMTSIIEKAPKCHREYSKCFAGDAVKAFFYDPEIAILIAQKTTRSWMNSMCNKKLKYEGKPVIKTACAIHWGVFSISTGQPEGYNFNLTNRVQKRASELGKREDRSVIIITKEALDRLPASSKIKKEKHFKPLGTLDLKDIKKFVEAWEVLE